MKKTILILLAAVMATVIAVAATGCGKSSDEVSEVSTIPKATNATSAPTQAASYGRYNSNATGTTRPANMTTASTDTTEAETQAAGDTGGLADIAMAYFSVSSDVGATAELVGTENGPDGTTFYNYTVYYAGSAYPIYISADGSQQLEPEYFNALFNSSQSYYEPVTEAYDYGEYNTVAAYEGY